MSGRQIFIIIGRIIGVTAVAWAVSALYLAALG